MAIIFEFRFRLLRALLVQSYSLVAFLDECMIINYEVCCLFIRWDTQLFEVERVPAFVLALLLLQICLDRVFLDRTIARRSLTIGLRLDLWLVVDVSTAALKYVCERHM